jgi:hypothetical protein
VATKPELERSVQILNSRARIGHGHTGPHVSSGHISNTVTSDIAFREYGNHREMKTMRGTASQTLHSIQESNQDHQGDGEKEFYSYAV